MTVTNARKDSSNKVSTDILLVIFTLFGIFFLLSLLSYSKFDPSFSNIVFSRYNENVGNLFGKLGALMADLLGTVFGYAALLIPIMFFYISVMLYRYRKGSVTFAAPLIAFVYSLLLITLLAGLGGLIGGLDIYFYNKPAGGALGVIAANFATSALGRVGALITTVCLILIFVMLLFSLPLSDIWYAFKLVWRFVKFIALGIFHFVRDKISKSDDVISETPSAPLPIKSEIDDKPDENALNKDELNEIAKIDFGQDQEIIEENNPDEPIFVRTPEKKAEEINIFEEAKTTKKFSNYENYSIPLSILKNPDKSVKPDSDKELKAKGELLIQKLQDFGVAGKIRAIQPGPVVTMFELEPAPGTRISKIATLENDLALNMSALSIRIIAPIPGKNAVGIEISNKNRAGVVIKEILQTKEFADSSSPLTVALGKNAIGETYLADIRKMPHLLVAGTTGSGKSVGINTMICSILYKSSPDEIKFIMIDPKMVELSIYEGIPHLLAPVVTDTRLAASVLKNVVAEMTRRYSILAEKKVRNIDGYNEIASHDETMEKMFYLVVVVDEFADLMMVAGKDVELSIARIAQMARAVGIHLIIATQRPTANVITGLIKANMPARLAFKVSQKNDSRIILDQNGADTLLGYGDSLLIPPGTNDPIRIHGAFVSDDEVRNIVEYLKRYGEPQYNMEMVKEAAESEHGGASDSEADDKYEDALKIAYEKGVVSISMIQRYLQIGYNRAARIVETMEARGIVPPSDGTSKPRPVIKR